MYGKPILQVIVAVLMALIGFLDDQNLNTVETINAVLVALTAFGVYFVPNLTGTAAKYAKMAVAMMTAGFTVLVTAVSSGVDVTEWLQVFVAILGAAGIIFPGAPQHPALSGPARVDQV